MATRTIERLILIFDANSGRWSALVDSAKKALQLNACSLCTITHGLAGEKAAWRECKAGLNVPVDYLHRDELGGGMAEVGRLPCVVAEVGGERVVLVTPDTLSACGGEVDALDAELRASAARHGLAFPD